MKKIKIILIVQFFLIYHATLAQDPLDSVLFAGKAYKIMEISPKNQKILIGETWCGENDIFYEEQVIHWNQNLPNQAIKANSLSNPSKIIYISKVLFSKKSSKDMSYKDFCNLINKGAEDIYLLWKGDTLKLDIVIDNAYLYRLRFHDTYKLINLAAENNHLFIPWYLFEGREGVVKCYIDRRNKSDRTDIENIDNFEVELIK